MELVTKKSECKRLSDSRLVKSPKEALRKTLKNKFIKKGLVGKLFPATVVGNISQNALWG